ncbi:3-hydroxyisobutyrate dehydrogenase [soil metagenome]
MNNVSNNPNVDTVGFVGLGTMGRHMASRLLVAGYDINAYDTDSEALQSIAERGAHAAGSLAEVAERADIVLLSLPSPEAVETVVAGQDGILSGLRAGGLVVDLSTIDPATATRLHDLVEGAGSGFLDAPVSGGPMKAEDGTLTVMIGGEMEGFRRCEAVLAHLGSNVIHVGPPGSGQMTKLCHNLLVAVIVTGIAESFATGVKAGLDVRTLRDVVSSSVAGNWLLDNWFPDTAFADDYDARFTIDLLRKDVSLFMKAAADQDVPVPVSSSAAQVIQTARSRGLGHLDMTSVVKLYEELAGVRLLENGPTSYIV